MNFNLELLDQAHKFFNLSLKNNIKIVSAESCTGGLIASLITEIAGSSQIFDRGFVVYSNESKIENLGVEQKTLNDFGAVSAQVAEQMATRNTPRDFHHSDWNNDPEGSKIIDIHSLRLTHKYMYFQT